MGVLSKLFGGKSTEEAKFFMCDICGRPINKQEIQTLTEEQVVRATSAGFVPSELPMKGV